MPVDPPRSETAPGRRRRVGWRVAALVRAIREGDEASIEAAVLRVSRSRRWLAPLALCVSALVLLFGGVRLVFTNWRLSVLQILPAMWIWLAFFDLKLHVLHGKSFHVIHGPLAWAVVLAIVVVTAVSFHLNAIVAFAITDPGGPAIARARATARAHRTVILAWGAGVGLALGFSTMIITRYGRPWFGLSLSLVVGVMMVCYVAVPARIIGVRKTQSRREKVVASAVSSTLGAVVSAPPYVIGRLGLLMVGSHALLIPGVLLLTIGVTLQAGTTGAVTAIKMSATLLAGSRPSGA
jgi:hypothetical protein